MNTVIKLDHNMMRTRLSTSKKYDYVNVSVDNDIKYKLFKMIKIDII